MDITLFAKSSSGGSYNVDFKKVDGLLTVWCDCPAGDWGKFCKHKWQLLNGNEKMLADSSQVKELENIKSFAIERNIHGLYEEVDALESKKKELAKSQKKTKEKIKKALSKNKVLSEVEFMEKSDDLFKIDKQIAYTNYMISKEKQVVEHKLKNGF